MHLPAALVSTLSLLLLLGGCGDEPEEQAPVLLSGIYVLDSANFESNSCGIDSGPLSSLFVEVDPTDTTMLRFPNTTLGGNEIPTPAATTTDGAFTLTFSGIIEGSAQDAGGDTVDCTVNVRYDLEASILDNRTWSIDTGKHTLEAVIGPAEACGASIREEIPGYDPLKGCSRSFTAVMKRET